MLSGLLALMAECKEWLVLATSVHIRHIRPFTKDFMQRRNSTPMSREYTAWILADDVVDWWFWQEKLKIRAHLAKMTLLLFIPASVCHSLNVSDLNSQLNPIMA